jgi:hypothetical protein
MKHTLKKIIIIIKKKNKWGIDGCVKIKEKKNVVEDYNIKLIGSLVRKGHKFSRNWFVGKFLQSTSKIDICPLKYEKHMLFK